jgi:predicted metal-dependent hydrolase
MEEFIDPDWGCVFIRRNSRSKRLIARYRDGQIQLTAPAGYSVNRIKQAFEELKPRLQNRNFIHQPEILNETAEFKTFSFTLAVIRRRQQSYYAVLKDGLLTVSFPEQTDVESAESQKIIRRFVESGMRAEAKRLLPEKVKFLAGQCGFDCAAVNINNSKTRWGSCSMKRNINLSYFLFSALQHPKNFR